MESLRPLNTSRCSHVIKYESVTKTYEYKGFRIFLTTYFDKDGYKVQPDDVWFCDFKTGTVPAFFRERTLYKEIKIDGITYHGAAILAPDIISKIDLLAIVVNLIEIYLTQKKIVFDDCFSAN